MPRRAIPKPFAPRLQVGILVLSAFLVGQSGDCEQPTGNTDLTLLELEEDGVNLIVGFTSGNRVYDATVSNNPVTVRAQSAEPGATISVSYLGASLPVGTGSGETDLNVALGNTLIAVVVQATGGATRSYVINVTHEPLPTTKTIAMACAENVRPTPTYIGFDLTVRTPSLPEGAASLPFDAELGGFVRIPRDLIQSASNLVPGGLQQGTIDEVVATVQVRSGATGGDVELGPDASAISPGLTNFCFFPNTQPCDPANDVDPNDPMAGNPDCIVPPCQQPAVLVVDLPVSTDCGPGGVCEAIGEGDADPNSGCDANGSCIFDDVSVPLDTVSATFTPDPSGEILFGFADQNVPDLVLCPSAAPDCSEAFQPDGAYDLPDAIYANPAAPTGIRFDLSSLFLPYQCVMAEPGGVCSGQPSLGCLTDTDCGAVGPCDFSSVEGVAMPSPDAALLAVPIGNGGP